MREFARSPEAAMALANAFEASPNPYVLVSPDLIIRAMNRAYLDVVHARREDIINQPLFEAFDSGGMPDNVRQVRESFIRARDTKQRDHLAVVRFAIQNPETGAFEERFWSATQTPILDDAGEVAFILQHTTDVTEVERLRAPQPRRSGDGVSALDAIVSGGLLSRAEAVQETNRRLATERNRLVEMFMQAPGFMAVLSGPEHTFQLVNEAYAQLVGHRPVMGRPIRDALPEVEGQGFVDLLDHVFSTGEPYEGRNSRVQLQQTPDAPLTEVFLTFIYQPIRDAEGQIVGIFVQGHDVTDMVEAADRQRLMIDELNHRVKNTLATVQSIAIQTARAAVDPAAFAQAFQARLMALSHTHNLLTRSHWTGASLHEVLTHEIEAHDPHRVTLNGPHIDLTPPSALALGMIFHELSTNAAKYGALAAADGRIFVDWSVRRQKEPVLSIVWREQGGPPVVAPDRKGFGTRLIERSVRHDLAGEVGLRYEPSGFLAEITVPLVSDLPE